MGRKNYQPGSNKSDRQIVELNTPGFPNGIIKGIPASDLPDGALADGENVICYPTETQGRPGSELYTSTELPPITGKTGLGGSKAGYIITSLTNIFTPADLGNYWVWPGEETYHEEITRYIDGKHVEVMDSSTRAFTAGCYMRGKINAWHQHSVTKLWLFLLDREFWIADTEISAFTAVLNISPDFLPSNAVSEAAELDDSSWIVFNSNGHFHVSAYDGQYLCWKRNVQIPARAIDAQTVQTAYGYGYIYSAARLTEQGHGIDRLSPSRIEVETGTNIWDSNYQDYNDVYTANAIGANNGVIVGPFYQPVVPNTDPVEYATHMTHIPIYRSLDKVNKYQQGTADAKLNDPERHVWVTDLRAAAAFYARKFNGHIIAQHGRFEQADVGSVVEFEDGSRDTIIEYLTPSLVRYADADGYYNEETDYMAACIGNGLVFRGSQSGTTLTRTHGALFTSDLVGKTIVASDGYRLYVESYTNANQVEVHESRDRPVQGFTFEWAYRNYYDTTSDETLRARIRDLTVRTRFLEPMPNVNDGIIVPGFMITCRRSEKELHYCGLEDNYEYTASFYNKAYQISTKIRNDIQKLLYIANKFVALCTHNTWHGPINTSEFLTLDNVGVVVPLISGIDILDKSIGCYDHGSIAEADGGDVIMLTNEPGGVGLRRFNGFSFGSNMLEEGTVQQGNFLKEFRNLQKATAAIYDGFAGYIIWGRPKV